MTAEVIVLRQIVFPAMSTGGISASASQGSGAAAGQPSLQVKPPKSFEFTKFEECPRWIKRFERYRVVWAFKAKKRHYR